MKIYTAPEIYKREANDICIFLAGGITNCDNWQDTVIDRLSKSSSNNNMVVFNPRRDNFPIGNPNESVKQITWEFKYIEESDIFSMYFCNANYDQPICMYELGRNIVRMQEKYPNSWQDRIIITVEPGYKRAKDVEIQVALATNGKLKIRDDINVHAAAIGAAYAIINSANNKESLLDLTDNYII